MKQQEIHAYLKRFFTATDCEIEKDDGQVMSIQLTIEMDKLLMNRPFYWHYIKKTGGKPNPQKLTLITDFNNRVKQKGDFIHFGSPRLHQIFSVAKKEGAFIRLFENQPGNEKANTPLFPWVCLNVKVSYIAHRRKDQFRSIGVNLMTGMLKENFHHELLDKKINVTAKLPDFAFTFTPLIKPQSGIRRIKQYLEKEIRGDDHTWIDEAMERWADDEKLLNAFYKDEEEKPERYYIEKEAMQNQYEPKIEVSIINGGLFYLTKNCFVNKTPHSS